MKRVIILIPIFNDWESLKKLIIDINDNIKDLKDFLFDCYVINDASEIPQPKLIKPVKFNSFKILNMFKNKGHARCNAFGIRYLKTAIIAKECSIKLNKDICDGPKYLLPLIDSISL